MKNRIFWGLGAVGLGALCACGGSTIEPISGAGGNGDSHSTSSGPDAGSTSTSSGATGGSGPISGIAAGAGGTTSSGAGAAAGTGQTTYAGAASVDSTAAQQAAGTWTGYIENFKFSDGSDALKLVLAADGSGQIAFGNSAPPPPVSDPNVGYPPDLETSNADALAIPPNATPYPGFVFTVYNASLQGTRLQFDVFTNELWSVWCADQTPMPFGNSASQLYGCFTNSTFMTGPSGCSVEDPTTNQWQSVDCGKIELCRVPGLVCSCNAASCAAALSAGPHFDMQLAPPKADGSATSFTAGNANVHLTKN